MNCLPGCPVCWSRTMVPLRWYSDAWFFIGSVFCLCTREHFLFLYFSSMDREISLHASLLWLLFSVRRRVVCTTFLIDILCLSAQWVCLLGDVRVRWGILSVQCRGRNLLCYSWKFLKDTCTSSFYCRCYMRPIVVVPCVFRFLLSKEFTLRSCGYGLCCEHLFEPPVNLLPPRYPSCIHPTVDIIWNVKLWFLHFCRFLILTSMSFSWSRASLWLVKFKTVKDFS